MNVRDTSRLCLDLCDWSQLFYLAELNVLSRRHVLGASKQIARTHFIAETIRLGATHALLIQSRTEPMCIAGKYSCTEMCMMRCNLFHTDIGSPECAAAICSLGYHIDIHIILQLVSDPVTLIIFSKYLSNYPTYGTYRVEVATNAWKVGNIDKFWTIVHISNPAVRWYIFKEMAMLGQVAIIRLMIALFPEFEADVKDWGNYSAVPRKVRKALRHIRPVVTEEANLSGEWFSHYMSGYTQEDSILRYGGGVAIGGGNIAIGLNTRYYTTGQGGTAIGYDYSYTTPDTGQQIGRMERPAPVREEPETRLPAVTRQSMRSTMRAIKSDTKSLRSAQRLENKARRR